MGKRAKGKKKPPADGMNAKERRKAARKGKAPKHTITPGVLCECRKCRKLRSRERIPSYYVGIPIRQDRRRAPPSPCQSYECHLASETVDPEIQEELAALRNEPERVGSVTVERRRRL